MDDEFLTRYRQAPRPEFARRLQERIETPMIVQKRTWTRTLRRLSPALIAAALIVAAVLLFTFPPAQALAQDFLGIFRVKKFATVTINPARVQQMEDMQLDIEKLLSDDVQVVQDPGKPVQVKSPQEASRRAGFDVAVPASLPDGAKLTVYVQGEGEGKLTANVAKLQSIVDALGLTDVQIPQALDGAPVTIRKPNAVLLQYKLSRGSLSLIQSPSPEVDLPPGVNLAQLGEIGLRVLGLSADEAHDFAQKVDWGSTFLIPIPANAAEVRQVSVNGADGLMITSNEGGRRQLPLRQGDTVILWEKDGMVYALRGDAQLVDLLATANSVQ